MRHAGLRRKAELLERYLRSLSPIAAMTSEEYVADERARLAGERLLELIVECASDINGLLFTEAGLSPSDTYYSSFMRLPETGLVKLAVAKQLASIAALRNRLVHDYEDTDDALVHRRLAHAEQLFSQYLAAVRNRLAQSDGARPAETEN